MNPFLFALLGVNGALYGALGLRAALAARREVSPRFRILLWAAAAICGVFFLGALQRIGLEVAGPDGSDRDLFLTVGQAVLTATATTALLLAFRAYRRVRASLGRQERIVAVIADRPDLDLAVSELGLSSRELQVLEAVMEGNLTDREIAAALFIAPTTSGTHVRNIMKKAGVTSRRDLLLIDGMAVPVTPNAEELNGAGPA